MFTGRNWIRGRWEHCRWALWLLLLINPLSGLAAGEDPHIAIVGLFKNTAVLKIDGKQYLLKVGQSVEAAGSLAKISLQSADSRGALLLVNNKELFLPLSQRIGTRYNKKDAASASIPITGARKYETMGSINGLPVRFLVDTGATHIAMNSNHAARLGIDFRVIGRAGAAETASGVVKVWHVTLNSVKVGEISLNQVAAVINQGDFPSEVLLGMSFLGRVSMSENQGVLKLEQKF